MLNGIDALPESFVADANSYKDNMNAILIDHCEKSFTAIAEGAVTDKEYNPAEIAHKLKFIIGLTYMQKVLENASNSLRQVKESRESLDEFGFLCSVTFIRELQNSFMSSLKSTNDEESGEKRLRKLADDLSELRFTEEGILASMKARIAFVDELKAHVLGVKMFAEQELPEEVKELF